MTGNQIQYQRNVETERHNRVTEREQERSNRANESETFRHNYATEVLGSQTLAESRRHNMATESNQLLGIYETSRHNRVMEQNDAVKATASMVSASASRTNSQANMLKALSDVKYAGYNAETARISANASKTKAENDAQRVTMELELQPFKKWESGSKAFSNVLNSLTNRSAVKSQKSVNRSIKFNNYMSGFKSIGSVVSNVAGILLGLGG